MDDKPICTNCKNIADFGGNYTECVLLNKFVDYWWWRSDSPEDCPMRGADMTERKEE